MKVAVITYNTKAREGATLHPIGHYNPNWKYYCYTDNPEFHHMVYEPILIPKIDDHEKNFRRTIILKYMTHQEPLFQDYDVHFVHDANLQITGNPQPLIEKCHGTMGLWGHWWNCVYEAFEGKRKLIDEGKRWLDTIENLNAHEKRYRERKFPQNFGYWSVGVMVKDMNNSKIIKFAQEWDKEYAQGSYRDQLSVPQAIRESKVDITLLEGRICISDEFRRYFKHHLHTTGEH